MCRVGTQNHDKYGVTFCVHKFPLRLSFKPMRDFLPLCQNQILGRLDMIIVELYTKLRILRLQSWFHIIMYEIYTQHLNAQVNQENFE